MKGIRAYVDTNVFAYMYSENEPYKREIAINAINEYDCVFSTQTLNEFCNICTRKWHLPLDDIRRAIKKYAYAAPCCLLTLRQ
jgi:predicted nucleic acid-binding protein